MWAYLAPDPFKRPSIARLRKQILTIVDTMNASMITPKDLPFGYEDDKIVCYIHDMV